MKKRFKHQTSGFLAGLGLTVLLGLAGYAAGNLSFMQNAGLSALTVAILLGMVLGNLRPFPIPGQMEKGIHFSQKSLLRAGIVLYGFRITFQAVAGVGAAGLLADLLVISTTFLLGSFVGIKIFKLDRDTAMLTAVGSSICGAAAVIATEPVLKSDTHKTAVAVSTVVLFGTIAMFLYPVLYRFAGMDAGSFGIYMGSTIHEVAQVIVAGTSVGKVATDTAVIVKMTRIMLLAPFLLLLSLYLSFRPAKRTEEAGMDQNGHRIQDAHGDTNSNAGQKRRGKITIPWFALGFIVVAGIHSLHLIPDGVIQAINVFDTIILGAAMAALGIGTTYHRLKGVGIRPFLHAFVLFLFLVVAGYYINLMAARIFPAT